MNVVFLCLLAAKMIWSSYCLHQDSIVLCPEEENILQNYLLSSTLLSLILRSSRLGLSLKTAVGIVFSSEDCSSSILLFTGWLPFDRPVSCPCTFPPLYLLSGFLILSTFMDLSLAPLPWLSLISNLYQTISISFQFLFLRGNAPAMAISILTLAISILTLCKPYYISGE